MLKYQVSNKIHKAKTKYQYTRDFKGEKTFNQSYHTVL